MMKNEALRRLMYKDDINQSELARSTGVPQPTINRFLHGHSKSPSFSSVKKLAEHFGVTAQSLYDNVTAEDPVTLRSVLEPE
jgi:transcriptional regulator with XRE-family HTH domain|tara:strand:+ start:475 stop:720 length:246 start_codon:yes stop_codon:yes gene_type:complete